MKKAIFAYIPALHAGYIQFFENYPESKLFIIDKEVVEGLGGVFERYERDIRALPASKIKDAVQALDFSEDVEVINLDNIPKLKNFEGKLITPDEDVSREIAKKYLKDKEVNFDKSVFLRWSKKITEKEYEISPDRKVSSEELDKEIMKEAFDESERSSDWWRQVGALITKNGQPIFKGHNKHIPSEHGPNVFGDPRSNFNAGERIDLSTAVHAEAGLISRAAREGVSLEGASIYVTTFPCPNCAKLIAEAGIKKVYYSKGYSLLGAEKIFNSRGIEIIFVK